MSKTADRVGVQINERDVVGAIFEAVGDKIEILKIMKIVVKHYEYH